MNEHRSYTLDELAEDFGLTERTARHYIENVLPPHHKTGRGKKAEYGQDTWNCFAFIRLARERHSLRPGQVAGILREIPQSTVDRIVNGKEELAVMGVPSINPLESRSLHSASSRMSRYQASAELAEQLHLSESREAFDFEPLEAMERLPTNMAIEDERPRRWKRVFEDSQVRIDCLLEQALDPHQEEQIQTAAKMIRLALLKR